MLSLSNLGNGVARVHTLFALVDVFKHPARFAQPDPCFHVPSRPKTSPSRTLESQAWDLPTQYPPPPKHDAREGLREVLRRCPGLRAYRLGLSRGLGRTRCHDPQLTVLRKTSRTSPAPISSVTPSDNLKCGARAWFFHTWLLLHPSPKSHVRSPT